VTFLIPGAFSLLSLVGLLILFHTLRRRRQEATVSSTMLWSLVLKQDTSSSRIRRLLKNLLLALQILAIILLATGAANPLRQLLVEGKTHYVIIIDTSASMRAHDVKPNRFARAKEAAFHLVDQTPPGSLLSIVDASSSPRLLLARASDRSRAARVLQDLEGTDSEADWKTVLALVRSVTGNSGKIMIDVFTDGALPDEARPVWESLALNGHFTLHQYGSAGVNTAITAFSVRNTGEYLDDHQVFVQLHNFSENRQEVRLELVWNNTDLQSRNLLIPAGGKTDQVFSIQVREPGILKGVVHPVSPAHDFLATDNVAYAVFTDPAIISALLVNDDEHLATPILKALGLFPNLSLRTVPPGEVPQAGEGMILYDIAFAPAGFRDLSAIPAETVVAFAPVPAEEYPFPVIINWDRTFPCFRFTDWGTVTIKKAAQLPLTPGGRVLIYGDRGPLAQLYHREGKRILLFHFTLDVTDLPSRVAFPILIQNLLEWAKPGAWHLMRPTCSPGEPLNLLLPETWNEVEIIDPTGERHTVHTQGGKLTVKHTPYAGLYSVVHGYRQVNFAINLLNQAESRIQPAEWVLHAPPAPRHQAMETLETVASTPIRDSLLLMAILILVIEATVFVLEPAIARRASITARR